MNNLFQQKIADYVIDYVCEKLQVNKNLVLRKNNLQHVVEARHIIGYILRNKENFTIMQTMNALNQHRSTYYHQAETVEGTLFKNKRILQIYEQYIEYSKEKIVMIVFKENNRLELKTFNMNGNDIFKEITGNIIMELERYNSLMSK